MKRLCRVLVAALLAVSVPFLAARAVSAGQDVALEQCHDGHEGDNSHGKASGSYCGACCASAVISGTTHRFPASPVHGTVHALPGITPLGDLPGGLDRPPRSL